MKSTMIIIGNHMLITTRKHGHIVKHYLESTEIMSIEGDDNKGFQ